MRACWLKWVGRDWSISADYIWLNYSGANSDSFLVALEREPAPSLGHRRDGRHVLHVGVLRHGVPAHMEHSGDFGPQAPGGIHRPYIIHRGQGHGHLLHPSRAGSPK